MLVYDYTYILFIFNTLIIVVTAGWSIYSTKLKITERSTHNSQTDLALEQQKQQKLAEQKKEIELISNPLYL